MHADYFLAILIKHRLIMLILLSISIYIDYLLVYASYILHYAMLHGLPLNLIYPAQCVGGDDLSIVGIIAISTRWRSSKEL